MVKLLFTRKRGKKKKTFTLRIWLDSPVSTNWEEKKVHSLGQNPEAAVGSKRATKTEENRFTALLSKMGFPAMCLVSRAGLLTTRPVLSSRPEMEREQMTWNVQAFFSRGEGLCKILSALYSDVGDNDMALYLKPSIIKDLPAEGGFTTPQWWSLISLEFFRNGRPGFPVVSLRQSWEV